MTDTLVAEINRTELHSLEVPDSFETSGSFVVDLRNRGESVHVHLHLDDALSEVASLEASNHYVNADSSRRVLVDVDAPAEETVVGRLKIVTAYGAVTRYVTVTVDTTTPNEIEVDPDLGKPQSAPEESSLLETVDPSLTAVLVLGLVAIILAFGAVVATDGVDAFLAVLAVLAAVVAAGLLTVRQ